MDKTIDKKVKALFKYAYLQTKETRAIHQLVQSLNSGKWIEKGTMSEIISEYVIHNETMMEQFMQMTVMAQVNSEGTRRLLDAWEKNIDMEIKEMESKNYDKIQNTEGDTGTIG